MSSAANSLDTDQAKQNSGSNLDPNCYDTDQAQQNVGPDLDPN